MRSLRSQTGGRSVEKLIRIGMDTSKQVFQLHGVNAAEEPARRRELRRKEMMAFFQRLGPTVVGIEACGGAHRWARTLQEYGHQVKLLPPKYAKA
jgi:transposase